MPTNLYSIMVRHICLVSPLCQARIARIARMARIARIARTHARGRPTAKQSCTINTTAHSLQFRWSDVGYINKFIVNIVASSFPLSWSWWKVGEMFRQFKLQTEKRGNDIHSSSWNIISPSYVTGFRQINLKRSKIERELNWLLNRSQQYIQLHRNYFYTFST